MHGTVVQMTNADMQPWESVAGTFEENKFLSYEENHKFLDSIGKATSWHVDRRVCQADYL